MYKIRPVERKDCLEIFRLSNDPMVRKMSLSEKKIRYADHLEWFERVLADRNVLFLVVTVDEKLAAQVRFKLASDSAEISISIAAGYRGVGYSRNIMEDAINLLKGETNVKKIRAVVRKSNSRSINYFYKCGYNLSCEQKINDIDCLILEYGIRG
jgi:spore coat polysaccharide biosynthesis protein SpsF